MTGRIILAGVLGGIAMFVWGFLSHVVLPLGEMGISTLPSEQTVIDSVKTATGDKDGLYLAPAQMPPGATSAPTLFMVYRANVSMSENLMSMLPQMLSELGIDIVEAIILAGILAAMTAATLAVRIGWAAAAGLMAALTTNGSYHIWYGFPMTYTFGAIIEEVVGFTIVGIVAALILSRRSSAAA